MRYALPPLPYPSDALEPFYDKATVEIHHGKHHATYVQKLNQALERHSDLPEKTVEELIANLEDLPGDIRQAAAQNGGGHANHSLFWRIMGPPNGGRPSGPLLEALTGTFGGFAAFQEKFAAAAAGVFGSGWTWLVLDSQGRLELVNTPNQDSPVNWGGKPVLALDLWEHAYYLKFQNRRAEWIDAWWNIVNWHEVSELYAYAVAGADLRELYVAEVGA